MSNGSPSTRPNEWRIGIVSIVLLSIAIAGCNRTANDPLSEAEFMESLLADIAGPYHLTDSTVTAFNLLISADGRFYYEVLDSDAMGGGCGDVHYIGGQFRLRAEGNDPCPIPLPQGCAREFFVREIDNESIQLLTANGKSSVWVRGRECPIIITTPTGDGYNEEVGPCEEQWVDESTWCVGW